LQNEPRWQAATGAIHPGTCAGVEGTKEGKLAARRTASSHNRASTLRYNETIPTDMESQEALAKADQILNEERANPTVSYGAPVEGECLPTAVQQITPSS
jgi:hypothetical protein